MKMRAFIAFDTPPDVRSALASVRDRLRQSQADVRWEAGEKFHCTLKFLGDTDSEKIPLITSALGKIGGLPFDVRYRGVGHFPEKGPPKVIWAGIENSDGRLRSLHEGIDGAMEQLGFERERRPYQGHITLGRVRSGRNVGKLLEMMETITFESQPVTIRSIEVIKSELNPDGSVYTILKAISLGA